MSPFSHRLRTGSIFFALVFAMMGLSIPASGQG